MTNCQLESESFLGPEELNDHFCGPQRERPREESDPMSDVQQGDFIMLLPSDTQILSSLTSYFFVRH